MQHTFAHDAVLDQRISEGCEEALTMTQGHSRQTAQEFYVMRQMEKAADTACSVHKRLYGEVSVPKITLTNDEEFLPNPDDCSDDTPTKKRSRTTWSHDEEIWIVGWIEDYVNGPTFDKSSKRINWKKIGQDIQKNQQAQAIFDPEHLNTSKIMECAKRLGKKYQISVHQLRRQDII